MTRLILVAAVLAALSAFAAHAKETPLPQSRPMDRPIGFADTGDMRTAFRKTGDSAVLLAYVRSHAPEEVPTHVGVAPAFVGITPAAMRPTGADAQPPLTAFAPSGVGTGSGKAGIAVAGLAFQSGRYHEIVSRYAGAYGVPIDLAHAVIRVESNYRANAKGSAGEIGLMQIKPATARLMGYSGNNNGLYNPETNIRYGMKYLGKAYRLGGGTTCGTILKYNAGHGAKKMNPISAAYCKKVKKHLAS